MATGTDDLELVEIELVEEEPASAARAVTTILVHPDQVLRELDRRRDGLLDWRWRLSQQSRGIAIVAAGVVALVAGAAIVTAGFRARARRRPVARLAHLGGVVRRVIARPEPVPAGPTVGQKVLAAALTGLVSAGVRLLIKRAEDLQRRPEGV
jgi:hypothetical protein